jgi:hypothetical protein
MKNIFKLFVVVCALNAFLSGCTQWPTEKQSIKDIRPSVSFKAQNDDLLNGRVLLDNLDMGIARDYQEGTAILRILPGPHLLIISLNGQKIFEEKIYANEGVHQTFLIH